MSLFNLSEIIGTLKDNVSKALKVKGEVELTGRIVKQDDFEIETLINAQSVEAGGNVTTPTFTAKGAICYLLVNTDKQPWSVQTRRGPFIPTSGLTYDGLYPTMQNITSEFAATSSPKRSLLVIPTAAGESQPSNISEALASRLVGNQQVRFYNNHPSDTATVTIRILRIWGDR